MQDERTLDSVFDSLQKKLAFFQNLILLAIADGILEGDESDFLVNIGNKLGLTSEQTLPIVENLGALTFIIPADGLQKTMELQTLVQMMVQDGRIDDQEYILCQEYANRIGYGKDILDDMIKQFTGQQTGSGAH